MFQKANGLPYPAAMTAACMAPASTNSAEAT